VLSLLFYHEYKSISIKTKFDRSPQAVAGTNRVHALWTISYNTCISK